MKFFMPSLAVFPFGPNKAIQTAKRAGFDGVELLLAGSVRLRPLYYADLARQYGLDVRFHEAWTASESSSPSPIWRALEITGWLPNDRMRFSEKVSLEIQEPVVLYANEITITGMQPNHHLQTMSVHENGKFKLSYKDFAVRLLGLKHQPPVVFDTFHFLEWSMQENMRDVPAFRFLNRLQAGFESFGEVSEIHLADWHITHGRNVPLGSGELPLREFCRFLREVGWDGVVTPEEKPAIRGRYDQICRSLEFCRSCFK